jgi:hypothetical protein
VLGGLQRPPGLQLRVDVSTGVAENRCAEAARVLRYRVPPATPGLANGSGGGSRTRGELLLESRQEAALNVCFQTPVQLLSEIAAGRFGWYVTVTLAVSLYQKFGPEYFRFRM